MQLLIRALAVTSMLAAPAFARADPTDPRAHNDARIVLPAVVNGCVATACVETSAAQRADSLKNGTIIGAVVGGLALGGFGALVCTALREEGNPPCWKGVLTIGAVGAGIGAAAGAGVDALMNQHPRPLLAVAPRRR